MGGGSPSKTTQVQDIPPEFKPAFTSLFNSAFGAARTAAGQPPPFGFGQPFQGGATQVANSITGGTPLGDAGAFSAFAPGPFQSPFANPNIGGLPFSPFAGGFGGPGQGQGQQFQPPVGAKTDPFAGQQQFAEQQQFQQPPVAGKGDPSQRQPFPGQDLPLAGPAGKTDPLAAQQQQVPQQQQVLKQPQQVLPQQPSSKVAKSGFIGDSELQAQQQAIQGQGAAGQQFPGAADLPVPPTVQPALQPGQPGFQEGGGRFSQGGGGGFQQQQQAQQQQQFQQQQQQFEQQQQQFAQEFPGFQEGTGIPLAPGPPIIGPAFPEQFTAGTSPLEFESLAQREAVARQLQGIGSPLLNLGAFTAGGGFLSPESNPFLRSNIEASLRPAVQQFQNTVLPAFGSQAIQSGAFSGSSARDLAFNQLASGFGNTLADTASQIGFDNFQRERLLQTQAGQLLDQGAQLNQLTPEILAQVGLGQRELAQRPLDEALLQFQESINAPFRPLFPLASIIQGGDIGSIFSTTVPTPSPVASGIAGGLGGAAAGAGIGELLGGGTSGDISTILGGLLGGVGGAVG